MSYVTTEKDFTNPVHSKSSKLPHSKASDESITKDWDSGDILDKQ